jgi:hypothetical protein
MYGREHTDSIAKSNLIPVWSADGAEIVDIRVLALEV